jgi:dethiobiotin synthetase
MAVIATQLVFSVVLVVGMRVGCLNHALLSAAAIRALGSPLGAWVAIRIDPDMALVDRKEATLAQRLGAPLLGRIGYCPGGDAAEDAKTLDTTMLAGLVGARL